jgi:integrase|tara:strand:- start:1061 stop:2074 length:1014 start_codon:yes stop_codon:yes gene_type:complete
MYIRKRKGSYSVSIRRAGAKAINKTFAKKSDAHKFGIDVELQLQRRRYKDTSNASKTTLKSILERHLTERMGEVREPKKEQSRFNTICKSDVVEKFLIDLTPNDFAQFRDARALDGAAGATIIRELSFMSVAIRKAIKIYGCWIPEHPIPNAIKPKEAPPRNRRLNEGEHNLLKEYCRGAPKFKKPNPYWCDAIDFAIESALRLNEQLTLTWDNISIEKKVMTILAKHTKTRVQRVIPLTPRALEILRKIPRSIDGRVFPMSINNFNRGWRAICKNAGIKNLHWHDLRRESISRLLESGLSISECQMFSGHKTISLMIKTYTAHNPETVAKKLNANN